MDYTYKFTTLRGKGIKFSGRYTLPESRLLTSTRAGTGIYPTRFRMTSTRRMTPMATKQKRNGQNNFFGKPPADIHGIYCGS
ncbi:MAG: hypothetical protein IKQ95_06530 [Synergistaceae bacterium]|nr:hypothetical protein [Synergistaceae bacterium]